MEGVSKNHILSVLACTLKTCIEKDPMIRTICLHIRRSNLRLFSRQVLLKKLQSVLLHANIKIINYLYKRGLFNNYYILSVVVNIIKKRNFQENPDSKEILCHHGKYIKVLIKIRPVNFFKLWILFSIRCTLWWLLLSRV